MTLLHHHNGLAVVTQPPEIFYNDPKSQSFEVSLSFDQGGVVPTSEGRRVQVEIIYENCEKVKDQTILTPRSVIAGGQPAIFRFRVSQVSRSHLNRRFKLRFIAHVSGQMIQVDTTAFSVFSKDAAKRSRGKKYKEGQERASKRMCLADRKWIGAACNLLKDMAWHKAGYEMAADGTGVDKTRPIFRCNCCGAMSSEFNPADHLSTCKLKELLKLQKQTAAPVFPSRLDEPMVQQSHIDALDKELDSMLPNSLPLTDKQMEEISIDLNLLLGNPEENIGVSSTDGSLPNLTQSISQTVTNLPGASLTVPKRWQDSPVNLPMSKTQSAREAFMALSRSIGNTSNSSSNNNAGGPLHGSQTPLPSHLQL